MARKRAGLSQAQLGAAIGVSKNAISQMELGSSKNPSAENLLPLAEALGVDPKWLISGKGPMYPKPDIITEASLTPDEAAMLEKYRRMDADKQTAAQTVFDALAQPEQRNGTR